jgi:hypothetical protein
VISNELEKDQKVLTTNGTYPWSFVTQVFCNGKLFPSFPMSLYLPVEASVTIVSHIARVFKREREQGFFTRFPQLITTSITIKIYVCIYLVSFVHSVVSFSGLSILDCPLRLSLTFICSKSTV